MFDLVIFDWDGTLADTKWAIVTSFQEVLRKNGCEVTDEFIERLMGTGTKNTFIEALKATSTLSNSEKIAELVKEKITLQTELNETVTLFEGAIDLLDTLYNKIQIALASMGNKIVIDGLLYGQRIRKYFDVVVTIDEVSQPKPNPEVFLKCAITLNLAPEKCVVMEDSIFGVQAAKKAKMKCIAVTSGAYSKAELQAEHPDLIVNSMQEKEKLLNFILQ